MTALEREKYDQYNVQLTQKVCWFFFQLFFPAFGCSNITSLLSAHMFPILFFVLPPAPIFR